MPVVNKKYVTLPLTGLSNLAQFQLDNESTNSLKHLVKKISDLVICSIWIPALNGKGRVSPSWKGTVFLAKHMEILKQC